MYKNEYLNRVYDDCVKKYSNEISLNYFNLYQNECVEISRIFPTEPKGFNKWWNETGGEEDYRNFVHLMQLQYL